MTILRKIISSPDRPTLLLACGHRISTKAVAAWHGGRPKHPWTPCPTCGAGRAGRRLAGSVGSAAARATLARIVRGPR